MTAKSEDLEVVRRRDELRSAVAAVRDVSGDRLEGRKRWILPALAGAAAFVLAQALRRRRGDRRG